MGRIANPVKRALISVWNKTGIVDFARVLVDEFGIEVLSTGGTARTLKDAGIPVTLVEEVTGFPEMLDGRVKTLHPFIHAAILADRDNPEHMRQLAERGIKPIDLVVVNLYPFEKTASDPATTIEQAVEMIDIGGPCLLRAAAKNHKHVLSVCDPEEYPEVLNRLKEFRNEGPTDPVADRRRAGNSFLATSDYDAQISEWLHRLVARESGWPGIEVILANNRGELRYGENPHQKAELWQIHDGSGSPDLTTASARFKSDHAVDTPFSYNNYADASAALDLCAELTRACNGEASRILLAPSETNEMGQPSTLPCCVFVKHTNPCGVGIGRTPLDAYHRAYLSDPNAAMGGVLAVNFQVDAECAVGVMESLSNWGKAAGAGAYFVEVWLAPGFDESAIEVIRTRKPWGARVRLLVEENLAAALDPDMREYRSIAGGILTQTRDVVGLDEDHWAVVTRRPPSPFEMADLRLAWLVAKHTKSNAISICKDGMLIGNGAGQMSRVMSCRIATWLAAENRHGEKLRGSAAASDAFFPFPDGPNILIDAGITALIQPGGSKRDAETIALCDEHNVAMIHTGTRHFKH